MAATNLWNNSSTAGRGSNSDQTRSFLGTEQWGVESGGAPWGTHIEQAATTEATSSSTTRSAEATAMFSHHVSNDPWLVGSKTSVVQPNQDVAKVGFFCFNSN